MGRRLQRIDCPSAPSFRPRASGSLESADRRRGHAVPTQRHDYRFHISDALDRVRMTAGPIEAEGGAPVMNDKGDVLGQAQLFKPRIEIPPMLEQRITVGTRIWKLVGIAHADQVGRKAAAKADAVRYDVAPDVRAGRIPMQEHDRIACADIDIGHSSAQNLDEFLGLRRHYRRLDGSLDGHCGGSGLGGRWCIQRMDATLYFSKMEMNTHGWYVSFQI